MRTKIFFDGGCRPNPGRMELAVVIAGRSYVTDDAGFGSSLDAEWLALIRAVRLRAELGLLDCVLLGDSAAVVAQANGGHACRGTSLRHRAEYRAIVGTAPPLIRHIKRAQNLAGIALARLHDR